MIKWIIGLINKRKARQRLARALWIIPGASQTDGGAVFAPCPFHPERTVGAFRYFPYQDRAVCHSCQTRMNLRELEAYLAGAEATHE